MTNQGEVNNLTQELSEISERVKTEFRSLSYEQLNWKPSPERWSVAQCFDHLITGNKAYFPIIESVVKGKKETKFAERLPVLPKVWGRLLIKSLDPKTTRKMKAPAGFQPSASDVPATIIDDFLATQDQVAELMNQTSQLNLDRIIITSPANGAITYSLMDAYRIVVVHEQRHFLQAKRVKEEKEFPGE